MAAVAATGGDVLIQNVIPKHMDCISAKLREMGVKIAEYDDAIRVQRTGVMRRANVKRCRIPASRRTCSRRSPCACRLPRRERHYGEHL